MEFGFQHESKRTGRAAEFKDGKASRPEPNTSVELPFDVVVSILTRLPAGHLRRMRSVCRSWNSLISDGRFIREYSNFRAHVTKRPYIVSLYCDRDWSHGYRMRLFLEAGDCHHEFDMSRVLRAPFYSMSNSCDGLICVMSDTDTYLVNPSIQKIRALPTGSSHLKGDWGFGPDVPYAGLALDESTGEYKVARIFCRELGRFEHRRSIGCELYTVGSLHSPSCWKVINDPPLEPERMSTPVLVHGTIYWTVSPLSGEVPPEFALSLDVKSEKFDVILHPKGSSRDPGSRVVELGGRLCLADTHPDGEHMEIWVSKEGSNREWIKTYSIDLLALHDYSVCLASWTKPVTIRDGTIVFCDIYGRKDYYDPQSKNFVKHEHVPPIFGYGYDTAYTEIIVWPKARITL